MATAALLGAAMAGALVGVAADRAMMMRDADWTRGAPLRGMPPGGMPLGGMPPGGMAPRGMPPRGMPPRGMPTPAMRRQFVQRLTDELALTDSQRRQVEALMERQLPRMRAMADSMQELAERSLREPRDEMLRILTPEQQRKFAELWRPGPRPRP
jgi:hypothetical protein